MASYVGQLESSAWSPGRRDGSEECGVGSWDGDAVNGVQEVEDAVKAFWGEPVVGEGVEELGDDVDSV